MKQLLSIVLILLLAFAGTTEILHQLSDEDIHCNESSHHICSEEGHHYCSLCDMLLQSFFIAHTTEAKAVNWITQNVEFMYTQATYVRFILHKTSRAPPSI